MPRIPHAIQQFRAYLQRRNYAAHTLDSYTLDLQVFFADVDTPLTRISFREVERFLETQRQQGLAPPTINRRLFAQIQHPLDRALLLLMLRCGLRVSEVAQLTVRHIDWSQHALLVEQGKGRKDRRVYLSADAVASLRECVQRRPSGVPGDAVFWNHKRHHRPLSIKAIQKKMERYAKAAGITASCHSLRHTFASNLLEQGAEIVSIRELLGHASITSSERYAKVSNQHVKQVYVQTMK